MWTESARLLMQLCDSGVWSRTSRFMLGTFPRRAKMRTHNNYLEFCIVQLHETLKTKTTGVSVIMHYCQLTPLTPILMQHYPTLLALIFQFFVMKTSKIVISIG